MTRSTLLLAALCAATAFSDAAPRPRIAAQVDNSRRTRLTGHVHPAADTQNDIGPVDEAEALPPLTLMLQPTAEQEQDLERLIAAQEDPSSASYHQWLTPEQYAERFGVNTQDIEKVRTWLESQNLHVVNVARAQNSIQFTGTAGDVARAFQTELHRFRNASSPSDQSHFANTTDPSVPTGLRVVIRGIHGLNNFRLKPRSVVRRRDVTPEALYTSTSGAHYLSPSDLATIYNVKALQAAGYTGAGQTIVIPGQSRVDLGDIRQFRTRFNLPAADPETLLVPNLRDPGTVTDDMGESDLDIEWAAALAPDAKILFVYSYNVMDALQYAIDHNLGPVISLSYGLCESLTARSDALAMQTWAKQANAQGITWVNASGDSGGADCVTSSSTRGAGLAVDLPAGIPEVTGVGGTEFVEDGTGYWNATTDANGGSAIRYIPEAAWNDSTSGDPASGGGGSSTFFARPTWQTGAGVPSEGGRNVPDISLNSSAEHDGYLVYTSGKLSVFGGTSAAAPAFAGMLALLNQYLVATGAQSAPGLGNVNPRLYALAQSVPSAFHDVQAGDNIVTVTCGTRSRNCTEGSFGFKAAAGYDLATGLGSVDVWNLVSAWRSQTSSIARGNATVTATASSGILTSSAQATIQIAVAGNNGGIPTGTVTVLSGTTAVASGTLDGRGVATLTISANRLATGSNSLTVSYPGDSAYNPATSSFTLTVVPANAQAPFITAVVNGASFVRTFAPGMVLTVYGSNLAPATAAADRVPLSTTLGAASVTVAGVAAPLYYASPSQLNVQIPFGIAPGTTVPVVVTTSGGTATTNIAVLSAAPGIFTDANGGLVPSRTARRGQPLTLYINGQGPVSPAIATGAAPTTTLVSQMPAPTQSVRVTIGGVGASLSFVGIPTGLVGITQINCTVPTAASTGTQSVVVTIGGYSSNAAQVVIQ